MTRVVHVRLADKTAEKIQETVNQGFFVSTSDFIRQAVKGFLEEQERKKALKLLEEKKGSWARELGRVPSDEEVRKARERAMKELKKEMGVD
jgi:Arc/MetJ-type ribon-helix-helix transcriptional regulator